MPWRHGGAAPGKRTKVRAPPMLQPSWNARPPSRDLFRGKRLREAGWWQMRVVDSDEWLALNPTDRGHDARILDAIAEGLLPRGLGHVLPVEVESDGQSFLAYELQMRSPRSGTLRTRKTGTEREVCRMDLPKPRVKYTLPEPEVKPVIELTEEQKARLEEKRLAREEKLEKMTAGARNVYLWREMLIKKFGNLIRGWVLLLDKDKSGVVSKKEFYEGCEQLKFEGDVNTLWLRLDRDHSGTLTLTEHAPRSADEIADFKHWARKKFGGLRDALVAMDKDHNGKLSFDEFKKSCESNGFESEHLKLIFAAMDIGNSGTVEADEVRWLDKWDPPGYLYYGPNDEMWAEFRKGLLQRHRGNAILAWRRQLDRDASMRVNWLEFQNTCKRINTPLCCFQMWRAADRNLSGWISIREFDQSAFDLLAGLKCWSNATFGSVSAMFHMIDKSGDGEVTYREWQKVFEPYRDVSAGGDVRMSSREIKHLFEGLDLNGNGKITIREVEFLEKWNLNLDIEEEQVLPNFRIWTTGKTAAEGLEAVIMSDVASARKVLRRPTDLFAKHSAGPSMLSREPTKKAKSPAAEGAVPTDSKKEEEQRRSNAKRKTRLRQTVVVAPTQLPPIMRVA